MDNQIKTFLEIQYITIDNKNTINKNKKVYFKSPYVGTFSNAAKIKPKQIFDKYCKNTNIAVAFSPSNIYKEIHIVDKFVILIVLMSLIAVILILGCNSRKSCI